MSKKTRFLKDTVYMAILSVGTLYFTYAFYMHFSS